MNFDEIKKAMNKEDSALTVPMSVSNIKSSHSSIKKIKKKLTQDNFFFGLFIPFLILIPFIHELHASAQILYNYTAFGTIMSTLGFLVFQIKLIRGLNISDLSTKRAIEGFLIKVKASIEVSKYLGAGIVGSLMIPITILKIGSKSVNESETLTYLYLNIPLSQISLAVLYLLIYLALGYWFVSFLYKKIYTKEIQTLEKILDQF